MFFLNFLNNWNAFYCFPEYFTLTATTFTKTVYVVWLNQNVKISVIFRNFNGKLRNGRPKYCTIRHQRIQINSNHHFVFRFAKILCFMLKILAKFEEN